MTTRDQLGTLDPLSMVDIQRELNAHGEVHSRILSLLRLVGVSYVAPLFLTKYGGLATDYLTSRELARESGLGYVAQGMDQV